MKFKSIIISVILLIICLSIGGVSAGENNTTNEYIIDENFIDGETVTALETGHMNTSFTENYNGYCIEYGEHEATKGDNFTSVDTSYAKNRMDGTDVSSYLKTFVTRHYSIILTDKILTQHYIWSFTDNFKSNKINKTILMDVVDNVDYSIPDDNYMMEYDNQTLIFNFRVFLSPYLHHQNFFAWRANNYTPPIINNTNVTVNGNSTIKENNTNEIIENIIINKTIVDETNINIIKNYKESVKPITLSLNKHITGHTQFIILIILIILILTSIVYKKKR